MTHTPEFQVSRRGFIVGTAAGAIGISLGMSEFAAAQSAAQSLPFSPVAWVIIAPDNSTTKRSPPSRHGESMARVLARNRRPNASITRSQLSAP